MVLFELKRKREENQKNRKKNPQEQLKPLPPLTEERAMCGQIRALQHLRHAAKRAHNALDYLEGGRRALAQRVRQAVWVVGVDTAKTTANAIVVHAAVEPAVRAAIHAGGGAIAGVGQAVAAAKRSAARSVRPGGAVPWSGCGCRAKGPIAGGSVVDNGV